MFNERHSFSSSSVADFMYRVYAWMAVGLGVSAVIASVVASNPVALKAIVLSPLRYVLLIAQFAIALILPATLNRITYGTAVVLFSTYAILTGMNLAWIVLVYTMQSIYLSLAIASGTFAAMSLYGYVTKSDLTSLSSFLSMGLIGLMIALFANMWFQSPVAQYYISLIAVGLFTLLTAYDVQKIKHIGQETMMTDEEGRKKVAIVCSLILYLDYINLFLHLLQLFGKRRD